MKSVIGVVMLNIMLLCGVNAQVLMSDKWQEIVPTYLTVSDSKTTNLLFPYAIRAIDRGSKELLVQKATNAENVLQVKAASPKLTETNLTVITASGTLYSFLLNYAKEPSILNVLLDEKNYPTESMVQLEDGAGGGMIQRQARTISVKDKTFSGKRHRKHKIRMELKGLYMHNDLFYMQVELCNQSSISFTLDQCRIFIQDKRTAKRTASQQIEVSPVHIEGTLGYVPAHATQTAVFVLNKFNIPDKKLLHFQVMEKDGGRHLHLKLRNKDLLKGRKL